MTLAGDVMLGRLVNDRLALVSPSDPWSEIAPLLQGTDAFVFNLENAVCGELPEWEPVAKTFHFRLDPSRSATLVASGVSGVQIANNHVMDFGREGLLQTLVELDRLGIPHAGAGKTRAAAMAPAFVARDIALVAAADHLREWAATEGGPGMFLIDASSVDSANAVATSIARARQQGAEVVILGLHWGPNMRRVPPPEFRSFARSAIDAGATIVWGTSAHLFQGIEFYGEGAILYDTGDFLDDYAIDPDERNDLSFLFRVELDAHRVSSVRLDPVRIHDMRVTLARGADRAWALERMRSLCEPLGTRLTTDTDAALARPAAWRERTLGLADPRNVGPP